MYILLLHVRIVRNVDKIEVQGDSDLKHQFP